MLTLDISNYGGELTPKIVSDWKIAGVEKVVVGIDLHSWNITLARRQLAVARDGGMRLGAYREAYWGSDVEATLALVNGALAGFNIEDMGIAFEDQNAPEDAPEAVCAWIQHNLDVASRYWPRTLYYGAAWWHNPFTGSSTRFKDWPLWVADYNGIPDATFTPFGGWSQCFRHQFLGSVDYCHYSVDVNWEDDVDQQARDDIKTLIDGHKMQQGALDQLVADVAAIKTGTGWIAAGLNLLKSRVDKIAPK